MLSELKPRVFLQAGVVNQACSLLEGLLPEKVLSSNGKTLSEPTTREFVADTMSIACCNTEVYSSLMNWRYCCLVLSHRYNNFCVVHVMTFGHGDAFDVTGPFHGESAGD